MNRPIPVLAILAEAGDLSAPEGTQRHDLARVHGIVIKLIGALRDCIDADQPMSQMRATERARAALTLAGVQGGVL